MSKQEVILCEDLESSLKRAIDNCPHDRPAIWNTGFS